jgi:hypothetical protein
MTLRRIPWVSLGALVGITLGVLGTRLLARGILVLPPCPLKVLTGWPCATCGLTRWAQALGRGDWGGAFHWHPVASVVLAMVPLVLAWDLRRAWRGERWPSLPESAWARGAAWALLLGTWLLQAVRGI